MKQAFVVVGAGFGDAAAKALFKGLSVNLGDGIQLTFDIPKNINSFRPQL
jgi:hypothetical protein